MIVGDPARLAIESSITRAYSRLSFRALGFFVLHIGGRVYGVRAPDATMLANSFDQVRERLADRGTHIAPFAAHQDAGKIADAYRLAGYAPDQETKSFFGMPQPEFSDLICRRRLVWAPDGDEAFDDGSYVLQFDCGHAVRLVGFKFSEEGYLHQPGTLSDLWMEADEFYSVLAQWIAAFEAEWNAADKIEES